MKEENVWGHEHDECPHESFTIFQIEKGHNSMMVNYSQSKFKLWLHVVVLKALYMSFIKFGWKEGCTTMALKTDMSINKFPAATRVLTKQCHLKHQTKELDWISL